MQPPVGTTLRALEEASGPMAPARACALLAGVLDVLADRHRRGLVDGRLTPGRVLVDIGGGVSVADPTVARPRGPGVPTDAEGPYLSPEAAGGGPIGPRSDVYAVGVMLYEALTDRLPFASTDTPGTRGAFPPSRGLPDELDLVLRRALAPDPAFRYPSAEAFASALREATARAERADPVVPRPVASPWRRPGDGRPDRRGRREGKPSADAEPVGRRGGARRMAAAGFVLVVGLALAGLALGQHPPPGAPDGNMAAGTAGTGPHWSAITAPTAGLEPPAGADAGVVGSFTTPRTELLSCPSATFCVGVGPYADGASATRSLLETDEAGTWVAATAPTGGLSPAPASADPDVLLQAVSCPVAGWCVAVGSYRAETAGPRGLIETLDDGAWHATTAPQAGASGAPARVSCSGVGACVAVGDAATAGTIWTLAGGTWRATAAPTGGLDPPAATTLAPRLTDVACADSGSCVAVGLYYDGAGAEVGLTDTLSSGTWRAATAPSPAGVGGGGYALQDVSCPAVTVCVAMGGIYDRDGSLHGVVDTLASGSWSATLAPVRGLALHDAGPQWLYVTSLTCPAPDSCLAAGWYFAAASHDEVHSFLLTLSGGLWRAQGPAVGGLDPPSGSGLDIVPWAVACRAPGSCVAVGSYYDGAGDARGLVDTFAGGRWKAAGVGTTGLDPAPGTDPGLVLGAVSCPPAGDCVAFGSYQDGSGDTQGVVARGD